MDPSTEEIYFKIFRRERDQEECFLRFEFIFGHSIYAVI